MVAQHRLFQTAEGARLREIGDGVAWRRWGPYLSERQWGTVREDYSHDGNAWTFFPHAHALSRAYRWGEDGLAGFCDAGLRWCLGLALWNGNDPFLKERLFGLGNGEGNHGEDVKEVYHYADALPSHAYNRMVYRYPHAAFPYAELVARNAALSRHEPEVELADTGIFAGDAFFDVTVEYAKASPDDVLMQVSVRNAAATPAVLHVLPQVWGRNTWSWSLDPKAERAWIDRAADGSLILMRRGLKPRRLSLEGGVDRLWLFTENDTNAPLLFGADGQGPFKDGINDYVVHGRRDAVSRRPHGSKAAAPLRFDLPGHGTATVRLRLRLAEDEGAPFADFDRVLATRRAEADAFYAVLQQGLAAPSNVKCTVRPSPDCCGANRSTSSTCRSGSPATPAIQRRRSRGAAGATRNGRTSTMPT